MSSWTHTGPARLAAAAVAVMALVVLSGGSAIARVPAHPAASGAVRVSRARLHVVGTVNLRAVAGRLARANVRTFAQGAAVAAGAGGVRRIVDNEAASFFQHQGASLDASGGQAISSTAQKGVHGFVGLTGVGQATANGGIDLEPPDQGLCAGQGLVGEFINNAWTVYSPSGSQQEATIPSYAIFGQPSTDFFSDPRCYYDASTQRWILTEFIVGTVNSSGQETSPSVQYIAISNSFDPLGSYTIYSIDTTDSSTPGCPCFGDFDQLGVDDNGIYIATNEFSIAQPVYNGVVIYALSKQLAETESTTGIPPTVFEYRVTTDGFGQPYHVSPSSTPAGAQFAPGTEYFVESNADAFSDDHLIVYAMTDTSLLAQPAPPPLAKTKIATEEYAFPPDATQKAGRIPLGKANQDPEGQLEADFDAIQEVTYVNGELYAEADTATAGGTDGAAWFEITPTLTSKGVAATVANQGYVTAGKQNLIYPVIALNKNGQGDMAFTLSGPGYFPSAAYITFTPTGPTGRIYVAAKGAAPEDSFTCYSAFVGPNYGGCRWGDYSMGVAMGSRIYLATEMIPNSSRDYLTNWGTYVWSAPSP